MASKPTAAVLFQVTQLTQVTKGRFFLLIASLMWAIETSLFTIGSPSYGATQFLLLRNLFIMLFCLTSLAARKRLKLLAVARAKIPALLFVAIASGVIADLSFYYSLQHIPIVNGLVIGHLQPFFMLLCGFLLFKEQPLNKAQIIGGTIMFIASMLVSSSTVEQLLAFEFGVWQNLVVLGSAILWAVSTLAVKHYLTELDAAVVVFYRFLLSALLVGGYLLLTDTIQMPSAIIALNAVAVYSGISLWFLGLRYLSAPEVGFLELFSPLFGLILATFLLGQDATSLQVIGCLLMFVGFRGLIAKQEISKLG